MKQKHTNPIFKSIFEVWTRGIFAGKCPLGTFCLLLPNHFVIQCLDKTHIPIPNLLNLIYIICNQEEKNTTKKWHVKYSGHPQDGLRNLFKDFFHFSRSCLTTSRNDSWKPMGKNIWPKIHCSKGLDGKVCGRPNTIQSLQRFFCSRFTFFQVMAFVGKIRSHSSHTPAKVLKSSGKIVRIFRSESVSGKSHRHTVAPSLD